MDTGPLVAEQIEDGQKLIAQLAEEGFDLTVAFWVRFTGCAEHEWFFYIVSERVDRDGLRAAGLAVHQAIHRIPPPWGPYISVSELRLVGANDTVAKEVLAFHARYPSRTWFPGASLGSPTIAYAYVYPPPGGRQAISSASA